MYQLSQDPDWRTGFVDKPFGKGCYTVTLSSGESPWVTITAKSSPMKMYGHARAGLRVQLEIDASVQPEYGPHIDTKIEVKGVLDSYDSAVTLSPSTFTSHAHVWSNGQIVTPTPRVTVRSASVLGFESLFSYSFYLTKGRPRPEPEPDPADRIYIDGNAYYRTTPAPTASTVSGAITLSTYSIPLPFTSGDAALKSNKNLTGISPSLYYNSANKRLIVPSSQTATITAGTYYLDYIEVDGTLVVDTSLGTVTVFLNGNLVLDENGHIQNTTFIPARFQIFGQSVLDVTLNESTSPVHAYIESRQANVVVKGTFYGNIVADEVLVDTNGKFHYDRSFAVNRKDDDGSPAAVSMVAGTWESAF